jgi:hypothetical protein
MEVFPRKDDVYRLIEEACSRAAQLVNPYRDDLSFGFAQVRETLQASTAIVSQLALILSAGRRRVTEVEQKTVALIIGDDIFNSQQMSHLVRIRLICAELINLLSTILERINDDFRQRGLTGAA